MVSVPVADLEEVRDLLMERRHGSPARSPAHNARLCVEAMLTAAPVREEGGAVERNAILEMAAKAIEDHQKQGREWIKGSLGDDLACEAAGRIRAFKTALATREEAPAEAGEDFRAQVVKLLDELIVHIVAIGPDKPDLNTPMSRRVWREVFADLITALRAQPQAREEASSEDQAEEFIQAAINSAPEPLKKLGEFLTTVLDEADWATADGYLLALATKDRKKHGPRCWGATSFSDEMAHCYCDTTPPTQPLAEGADAEKLREAVEAIRAEINAPLTGPTHGAWDRGRIAGLKEALAALQQEGR
jgi:hypothetical protein